MQRCSSTGVDLSSLVLRARDGDKVALDSLLARYRPYLRLLAEKSVRPLFRSRFDGSDVVQQACYDAFRGIENLRGTSEGEFNAWLTRILQNNVANLLRDNMADRRDVRREQMNDVADSEVSIQWRSLPISGPRPESQMVKGEAALMLAQSLTELPADQQTAIQMRFLETYTLAEIAKYLRVSTSSVVRLIDRGLQALHHSLPSGVL